MPKPLKNQFQNHFGAELNPFFQEDWVFQYAFAEESLNQHFQTKNLKGFGLENDTEGIICAGAVLHYLSEAQQTKLEHISGIQKIASDDYVGIDRFTARNLELLYSTSIGGVALIDVIDHTATAMGGRLLRHWVGFPLKSREAIEDRHAVVSAFLKGKLTQ